jgi:hypothetical protein
MNSICLYVLESCISFPLEHIKPSCWRTLLLMNFSLNCFQFCFQHVSHIHFILSDIKPFRRPLMSFVDYAMAIIIPNVIILADKYSHGHFLSFTEIAT